MIELGQAVLYSVSCVADSSRVFCSGPVFMCLLFGVWAFWWLAGRGVRIDSALGGLARSVR